MKALYVALLSSQRLIDDLKKKSGKNPGYAGQKFNRLIIEGLKKNGVNCEAFSSIPVNRDISKKVFWNEKKEIENGISYKYIPFINLPYIHNICLMFYSFFYVLFWALGNRKEKFILMDILNVSICIGTLLACKIARLRCIGVLTDMPGLLVNASTSSKSKFFSTKNITQLYASYFDGYVLLTEQMNEIINRKNKPYIVMEGLADITINPIEIHNEETSKRSILYAGGLHERYGLKMLVEAFIKISNPDYKLIIYGSGPFVEDLKEYAKKDCRIEYRGVAPNRDVMNAEKEATILVNPRPTTEEFTKYSFPSKNMEYMSIGRPLLTTKLPGMPKDYYDYVYLFEEETVNGYKRILESVLQKSMNELDNKGIEGQKWILKNKNNVKQTLRIINLVKNI